MDKSATSAIHIHTYMYIKWLILNITFEKWFWPAFHTVLTLIYPKNIISRNLWTKTPINCSINSGQNWFFVVGMIGQHLAGVP